jgi:LPXTG-motif cell wall-anchored protein
LIPEGWTQVHKTDPETGADYWTLVPEDIPLDVPKTGGAPPFMPLFGGLTATLFFMSCSSLIVLRRKRR